ncbi:MAG: hypothetical protein ACOWWH_04785 [Eubacteriaceae bacterium]
MASNNSDIDLLVDSVLKGLRFVGLIEDIHNAVGKEVDILEVTHTEKNSMLLEARVFNLSQMGELVNKLDFQYEQKYASII